MSSVCWGWPVLTSSYSAWNRAQAQAGCCGARSQQVGHKSALAPRSVSANHSVRVWTSHSSLLTPSVKCEYVVNLRWSSHLMKPSRMFKNNRLGLQCSELVIFYGFKVFVTLFIFRNKDTRYLALASELYLIILSKEDCLNCLSWPWLIHLTRIRPGMRSWWLSLLCYYQTWYKIFIITKPVEHTNTTLPQDLSQAIKDVHFKFKESETSCNKSWRVTFAILYLVREDVVFQDWVLDHQDIQICVRTTQYHSITTKRH